MNILALSLAALLASPRALARAEEGDEHLRGSGRRGLVENGTPVPMSDYPSHVRVLTKPTSQRPVRFPHCGGTLIGPRVVLTAAHCDEDSPSSSASSDDEEVSGIAVTYDPNGEIFGVLTDFYLFNKTLPGIQMRKHKDLDLMLLKFEDEDITKNGREPATIRRDPPYVGGFMAGVDVNIAGGGVTDHTGTFATCMANGLNKADVEVRDCPSGWDSNTVLCAYNRGSRLCATDSGTGVFQKQWQDGWFGTGINPGGEDMLVGVVAVDTIQSGGAVDEFVGPPPDAPFGLCKCAKTFSSLIRVGTDDVIDWITDVMVNTFKVDPPKIEENSPWFGSP